MEGLVLGGSWLVASGVRTARELAIRCLELGFAGVMPAPGPRPFVWPEIVAATDDLPFVMPALRLDPVVEPGPGSLASRKADDVLLAHTRMQRGAALAAALAIDTIVLEAPRVTLSGQRPEGSDLTLEGGPALDADGYSALRARLDQQRDNYLDAVCRNLHKLAGELADFRICLTESGDLCSASSAEDLALILGDLSRLRLGYWHRPALVAKRAALGGSSHGETLEQLSSYLVGSDLSDFSEHGLQAAPGSGGVDYSTLTPYLRGIETVLPCVVELDPSCTLNDVQQGRSFLEKFGW